MPPCAYVPPGSYGDKPHHQPHCAVGQGARSEYTPSRCRRSGCPPLTGQCSSEQPGILQRATRKKPSETRGTSRLCRGTAQLWRAGREQSLNISVQTRVSFSSEKSLLTGQNCPTPREIAAKSWYQQPRRSSPFRARTSCARCAFILRYASYDE